MLNASMGQILPVPYYVQVSPVHCQSTVLKMYAQYLDRTKFPGSTAGDVEVQTIWNDINLPGKPDLRANKTDKNAHANIKQWLEDRYAAKFYWNYTKNPQDALESIVRSINRGYPVIAGVSHKDVAGHIVLIHGYVSDSVTRQMSASPGTQSFLMERSHILYVHDPYGAFHPSLNSKMKGKHRFDMSASLIGGGEMGAGKSVKLDLFDVSRQRGLKKAGAHGDFNLMVVA